MKTRRNSPPLRASVVAVHAALALSGVAQAQAQADPALAELTQPKSTVEVGLIGISSFSAKANEYSGIDRRGPFLLGNVDLRGGGAFDSADASRWRLTGSDLGLKSRSIDAEYGVQGRYRLTLDYAELLRNQSDSYQTPYQGAGSNALRLPSNWVTVVVPRVSATTPNARGLSPAVTASNAIVGGVSTPPTAPQTAAAAALQAADLPAFQRVDLFTKRTRYGVGWGQEIDSRWAISASIGNEHKEGLKPLAAHTHATGGDASSILPTPIDQDDRKASVGVSYTGESLQLQASYDLSSFKNNVSSVSWNLWSGPTITETMSTAPSNLFHKLLVSGSYLASAATRVTGSVSYSRSSQNEAFLSDTTAPVVPVASAQALVVNESASLKVFNRTTRDLSLSAGYKYDLRENRTPVNTYVFYDNNEAPTGTSPFQYLFPTITGMGTDVNVAANTPYSRRVNQIDFDADYQMRPGQHVKVGWTTKKTDRYCLGSWIDCANAANATENTLQADWFGPLGETVTARAGLASSRRRVDYDENSFLARVPMANQAPTGAPAGTTAYSTLVALGLNGYGPALGLAPAAAPGSPQAFYFPLNNALNNTLYAFRNRISELLGMRRYDQADRDRNKLRSSLTWQANDKLELQGGFEYSRDDYRSSTYGLQKASVGALNLDANYAPSDNVNIAVFASFEEMRTRLSGNTYTANSAATSVNGATLVSGGCFDTIAQRNANNKIDPCENWHSDERDRSMTLGASFARNRLLAGKLDLTSSLVYSDSRTAIDVTGGSYVNNPFAGVAGAATTATAAYYIAASALPTIKVKSLELNLGATYRIDPRSAVRVAYGFQRLISRDWGYEGMQDGAQTQLLPTRESAPNYDVHSIGISYVANF